MTNANQLLGSYGEARAAQYLTDQGYQILEKNWRCNLGEIDLVAKKAGTIAVVEVKTRKGHGTGHPFEAITKAKAARLRLLARSWSLANGVSPAVLQIDAIAVSLLSGRVTVEHLEQIA